jgi:hypothetical protein
MTLLHPHRSLPFVSRALQLGAACTLGAALVACGGDDARVVEQPAPPGGDTNPPDAPDAPSTPLYLVAPAFFNGDDVETYLITTSTFDASTTFDPTSGARVLGEVVPIVHNGKVFASDDRAPVIGRYDVGPDDQLVKGAELSFAGVGMTEVVSWFIYIVDDTKGYVFDPAGRRIVVWNPSTMTLTGTQIDLSVLDREGWTPRLALEIFSPWRRGSELLIPTAWTGQDEERRFANGLLILDVETDTVVSTAEDERCGESYMTVEDASGDRYFFPSAFSSPQHFFADQRGPTCVLRLRAGESAFDPDYQLDLSALGSGSAAVGGVPDGAGGFFFAAADDALWNEPENNGGEYWRIWHYDFATEASRPVDTLPVWAGDPYYVNVGGRVYLPQWRSSGDEERTTLYAVDGAADPTQSFSFAASWAGFGQLR